MQILQKANSYGVKCSVLTKGLLPDQLSELSLKNEYGITVVSLDEKFHEEYEPGAAPIEERIKALKVLHDKGCYTWVSIEPYPTPNICDQKLELILKELSFVDKIIFGRMNYNPTVTKYKDHISFYNACAKEVTNFCTQNKIDYLIKSKTIRAEK